MDLDVRRLRVLREVALRGTVTAAAESLGFTPSAVSQQLSALERETGVVLLERVGRRVRLTDAGHVLVHRTEPVLAALEEAQAALEESRDVIAGELRIAAAGSVARELVIPAAARVAAARPSLRVTVLECETGESVRELLLGHLDVVVAHEYAVGSRQPVPDGAARVDLFDEDMYAATPVGRYAAPVDLASLAGEVWAAEPPQSICGQATRAACRDAGFDPDIRYVSSDPGVVLAAVRCAGAVALLPRLAVAEPPPEVDLLPVAGAGVRRLVYAAHRPGSASRPGIALVLAELKAAARQLQQN
jgi:DNA-binding transcriptional LysR family regulator